MEVYPNAKVLRALNRTINKNDWITLLSDYRGGVDYPISFYYKEIMEVYPNAKVLLNVRDPVKWYQSVRGSILHLMTTVNKWPCTWFTSLIGLRESMSLANDLSEPVPQCSTLGLGMFGAVRAGQETAVKFWTEHVEEVKLHVPQDKLLVWEVKEGWGPLCKFLEVPEPSVPFPRVNDTSEILMLRKMILLMSWSVVIILPLTLIFLTYVCNWDIQIVAGAFFSFLFFVKIFGTKAVETGFAGSFGR